MYETVEEIESGIKQHGSLKQLSNAVGIPYTTLWDRYHKNRTHESKELESVMKDIDVSTLLNMDDVIKPHDSVGRVVEFLKKIPKGKFISDDALRKEVNLSREKWRRVRGSVRLAGYWYQCPDRTVIWSGDKNAISVLAERMKELV